MMKLETSLLLCIGSGDAEHELKRLAVEYRYIPADSGRNRHGEAIRPPEYEGVEVGQVYALIDGAKQPLPEWMLEPLDEQLERLCLDHWRGERDDALERRAEERRYAADAADGYLPKVISIPPQKPRVNCVAPVKPHTQEPSP